MVPPSTDYATKEVKDVKWDLYSKKNKKKPHWKDPKQSDKLMGCALASILCALANTTVGDKHIDGMIRPKTRTKKQPAAMVDLRKVRKDLSGDPPAKMPSQRYFEVAIAKTVQKVSSVFYTDDSKNVIMIYMGSPTDALWPCVIEKAYAKYLNKSGYAVFTNFADPIPVWKDIVGSNPQWLELAKAKTSEVKKVVEAAKRVPTIATSDVHGYTVVELKRNEVTIYDSWKQNTFKLKVNEMKDRFKWLFYGSP